MSSDVEVQDLAPPVLDNEEAVEHAERHRWNGEEVKRHDGLLVILQECQPPLARVATAAESPQIPSHASFRHAESEFLQFAMDPRRAPIRVLRGHALDQSANLLGDPRPATARVRAPAPVKTETSAVPADHGLGLHDDQCVPPARPEAAERAPEQPVERVQGQTRPFPFQNGDLLSESENLQGVVGTIPEEGGGGSQECEDEIEHESTLVTLRDASGTRPDTRFTTR